MSVLPLFVKFWLFIVWPIIVIAGSIYYLAISDRLINRPLKRSERFKSLK